MGGFAFRILNNTPESKKFLLSDESETWFLNYESFRQLFKRDVWANVIPNLSEEEILAKGKADGLAKALVCAQALWFIAQCLTCGMYCLACLLPSFIW